MCLDNARLPFGWHALRFDLAVRQVMIAVSLFVITVTGPPIGAAFAAVEEPVLIAERRIDLERTPKDGLTSEFVDVPGVGKRFGSIVLTAVSGSLTVKGLRVTGADAQTRDIVVDALLRSAAPPLDVPVADSDVVITRIEVLFRRPAGDAGSNPGTVLLQIAGRSVDTVVVDPAASSTLPSPSASSPAAAGTPSAAPVAVDPAVTARLVKLAARGIDLARSEIVFDIGADVPAVRAIQIRALDLPVIVRQVRVTAASGATREIKVGQLIETGSPSRLLDIADTGGAAPGPIRSIILDVRARTAAETGIIEIWGDPVEPATASANAEPPLASAPPRAAPTLPTRKLPRVADQAPDVAPPKSVLPRQAEERRWKLLGSTPVEPGGRSRQRRAVFSIRSVAGEITAMRFLPRRDVVRLSDARVVFADGREQRLDVRGFELEPGQMTDVLSVGGGDVVRVEVVYRAMDAYDGAAVLELWARIDDAEDPSVGRRRLRRDPYDDGRQIRRQYQDGPLPE